LFFKHNTSLGPPYQVLIDTNFLNFSITNKLDIFKGLMDLLLAKVTPIISDCVMAELEKLGTKYRVALRIAKDPRFQRLACSHQGTYADGRQAHSTGSRTGVWLKHMHRACAHASASALCVCADCIVSRVQMHKCYMVATCDKDLKRRIRKVPGVPVIYITQHKFSIERFADVNDAPRQG